MASDRTADETGHEQLNLLGLSTTFAALYFACLVFRHVSRHEQSGVSKLWALLGDEFSLISKYSGRFFNPGHVSRAARPRSRVRSPKHSFWPFSGSPSEAPPGLGNHDNSCYQNSVLQSLSSLKSVRAFLEKQTSAATDDERPQTLTALHELLRKLSNSEHNGGKIWTPKALKSMSSWNQQDAQEYYSRIVDDIGKDSISINRSRGDNGMHTAPGSEAALSPRGRSTQESAGKASQLPEFCPLEGLLAQRVACLQCGYADGLSLLPFNCLTLSVGGRKTYDVRDCLDRYIAIEKIEGVQCASCTLREAADKVRNLLERDVTKSADRADGQPTASTEDAFRTQLSDRLRVIQTALDGHDFADKTLSETCRIAKKGVVSSTKTKQAVVARAPTALVLHINRSIFDERTGRQSKNHASISYPKYLDLSPWILGGRTSEAQPELWNMGPTTSLATGHGDSKPDNNNLYEHGDSKPDNNNNLYELRAVAIHQGVHEDGHYVCYRQHAAVGDERPPPDLDGTHEPKSKPRPAPWWEISDAHVRKVSDDVAMHQHEAFLLFYERVMGQRASPGTSVRHGLNMDEKSALRVDA